MNLDFKNREWKEFKLIDIFPNIQRGKRLKKDDHIQGYLPYVSSTALNNGIDGFIGNVDNVRTFENSLTIANSGSVGATFYQPFKVIASDHVTKLENKKFNKYIYLFLAGIIKRLDEKYSFNREINESRIKKEKILLPVNEKSEPDYVFMEAYARELEKTKKNEYINYVQDSIEILKNIPDPVYLKNKDWREFFIEEILYVKSGKRLVKAEMVNGKIPFIGATDSNNGITEFISNKNTSLDKNILGVNYNGSVVENFYHPYEAIFSDDVKRLSLKQIEGNKYIYLFIKNIILNQKEKYEYGYKFNGERMKRQKIMLPVQSDETPDYTYMENYMKYLEYQKLKDYLTFKKARSS